MLRKYWFLGKHQGVQNEDVPACLQSLPETTPKLVVVRIALRDKRPYDQPTARRRRNFCGSISIWYKEKLEKRARFSQVNCPALCRRAREKDLPHQSLPQRTLVGQHRGRNHQVEIDNEARIDVIELCMVAALVTNPTNECPCFSHFQHT